MIKINDCELRLTTRGIVALEKSLGKSPIMVLMETQESGFPNIEDLATIIQFSIKDKDAYDLMDEYVAKGHTYMDLMPIIIEVFQECGYIPKPEEKEETDEKN